MDYEKNMSFLVIPKSPKVWKKVEKIGWAPSSSQYQQQLTQGLNTAFLCFSRYITPTPSPIEDTPGFRGQTASRSRISNQMEASRN